MYGTLYRNRFPNICVNKEGGSYGSYPYFTEEQETYSWRTGRLQRHTDVVQPPPQMRPGNLTANLSARKRYIEELGSNLVSQNNTSYKKASRFLTHDTGHTFQTVRHRTMGHGSQRVNGELHFSGGLIFGSAMLPPLIPTVKMRSSTTFNDTTSGIYYQLGPSDARDRLDAQRLFGSAEPDGSLAGLGETIVELLSGNMPKALTTLGKNIASGKIFYNKKRENLKDLGSDYLNQQFGWAPLMRDFQAILEDLLMLHNFLYESSYRRFRAIPPRVNHFSGKRSSINVGTSIVPPGAVNIGTGLKTPPGYGIDVTHSYDTRLTARFTRARPSPAANAFVDRATDLLHRYGVATPNLGWDLLPYSWLVDWALHLGRGIRNYSAYSKDGRFKTDYAYATTKSRFFVEGPAFDYEYRQSSSVLQHYRMSAWSDLTVATSRRQATPFGFAVDLTSLSSAQYGILVALGLARSR